jgi:DNA-binding GntR family transcriptional regulator
MPIPAMEINRSSPVPLYFQISRHLEDAVDRGDLVPGEQLPNEIDLAETLRISRPTMRRALEELVDKGLIVRKRGVGTQVANAEVRRRVALTSLYDDLAATGRKPETRVLRFETDRTNPTAARKLGEPLGEPLVYFERLRFADGRPLAILRNWLPQRFADLTTSDLETRGLYEIFGQRGCRPSIATQRITAQAATTTEAKLLGLRRNAPLISLQRTAFDGPGNSVEYADNLYDASSYAIEVTVFNR